MYLRPKTKRRLVILGSAFSIIVGVLVIGYAVRVRRLGTQIGHARETAMAAHTAGDHAAALEAFRFYLDETKTADKDAADADAEAILAYAKSRAAVEADKGRHLYESVKILDRYLRLRPNDAEARRMLFELQPRIGYNDEALQLADAALAENPDDADALWARVRSLRNKAAQDRQFYAQALTAAERLTKVTPDDLRAQVEALRLMVAARRPDAEIVARAESLRAAHANDPRFDLLLATAHLLARQPEPAALWLKTAASAKTLPDPAYVAELSRHLQVFSMFPLALDVVERGAAAFPDDADLARALAQQLWQRGRHEELLKRFAAVDPAKGDPALAGFRAMSLIATDHGDEAATVADVLGKRKGDAVAAGWAGVLSARLGDGGKDADLSKLAARYRAAAGRDSQNAVAHFLVGETYARMGETELAADAWEQASRLAPSWAAPPAMLARAAIDAGHYADAVRAAEAAYRRAPRDVSIAADWVVASYGVMHADTTTADAASKTALLANVEAVQKDAPGEPRTLPVYVALLAETGRKDDAAKAARAALAKGEGSADLVNRLAIVSRTHGLGLDAELMQRATGAEQQSSRAALRTAALLLQAGQADQGRAAIEAAKAKAVATGQPSPAWDVAALEYRDLAGDESTASAWAALADANPKDLAVQSAVLRSPARARDRALWERAVTRVKELTGADGHLWQIERARLALANNASGDELASAIALLEGVTNSAATSPEPRRLLALAYDRRARERGGDERRAALARACEEIGKAADLRPTDPTIARDLVTIYRAAGMNEQAIQHLDGVLSNPDVKGDAPTRAWIADAYAELGQFDKAAKLLDDGGTTDAAGTARLAAIRRRQGDPEEAADLYRKLLASKDADAAALIEAAEFFVDRGEPETAQQFVTKLTSLPLKPGVLELVRGRFQERRGMSAEALVAYRAATKVNGAGSRPWRELAGFLLRQRRYAEAVAAAEEGLKIEANEETLAALKTVAVDFEKSAAAGTPDDPALAPLLAALSVDPTNEAAREMQQMLGGATAAASAEAARALADRFPEFMPAQYRAVRLALTAKQFTRAEQLARRAARTRPDDPEAGRLVAVSMLAQGDWAKTKPAALAWRALAWNNPLPADLLVAEAMIETGDAAGAVDRLNGYVAGPAKDDLAVNTLHARALIAAGRVEDAAAQLEPRASRDAARRRAWLSLSAAHRNAAGAIAWVERIAPRVSADAADRLALAEAWFAAGQRYASDDAYRRGFDVISAVRPVDLDASGQTLLALCAQAVGDYNAAVTAHRAVFDANASLPEAKNNLAYALTLRGRAEDLSEAKRLAGEAVAARPDNATFRDTLARVDTRAGDLDAADVQFRAALQAEPYHLEARLGLADVLVRTKRHDEGKALLAGVEKDLRLAPALPPYLTAQLNQVREALAKR